MIPWPVSRWVRLLLNQRRDIPPSGRCMTCDLCGFSPGGMARMPSSREVVRGGSGARVSAGCGTLIHGAFTWPDRFSPGGCRGMSSARIDAAKDETGRDGDRSEDSSNGAGRAGAHLGSGGASRGVVGQPTGDGHGTRRNCDCHLALSAEAVAEAPPGKAWAPGRRFRTPERWRRP